MRSRWFVCLALFVSAGRAQIVLRTNNLSLEMDSHTRTRVSAIFGGRLVPLGPFAESETLLVDGKAWDGFRVQSSRRSAIHDTRGSGNRTTVIAATPGIRKEETIDAFPDFPTILFVNVSYTNTSSNRVHVDGWTNESYVIQAGPVKDSVIFWALNSGSYERRPDWANPLKPGFAQQNYLGMNAADYGGGTPVIDVWRPDVGLAVGHDELKPELVSEPVTMPSADHATVAVEYRQKRVLKPGETLKTFETFLQVHQGDYFASLREYRRLMIAKGVRFEDPAPGSDQPIWCAWGFGRNFQPRQIETAIPEARKLGIGWVTMDDGWYTELADWQPNSKKFPSGDPSMRALVDKIHAAGMKAQLWWAPLAASPSSELARTHPDWFLLDETGMRRKISYWDAYYLCPADPAVVRYFQHLAERIFKMWGFDGLKIDGQFLNAVPRCTNPLHHHASPLDSVQQLPYFFKAIADAAHTANPRALIELCPCGTAYSFFSMPYFNMAVASDPESSWQVRSKGKALKALMGDKLPYFGDHVELSDGGDDFASTIGVGGVIGTQYRWPPGDTSALPGEMPTAKLILTAQKEAVWKKWIQIYGENMLPQGQYEGGLYDIGFDKPETHCIRKGNARYYAFFAPHWSGNVELRGLSQERYTVVDYVHGRTLGSVSGPAASLAVTFDKYLLISAKPQLLQSPR
jgi:alpha-galactosidase